MTDLLFRIDDLEVTFPGRRQPVLHGVDLAMAPGESLALVGPSGCGKSLTARALCGLLPPEARWSGSITWQGHALTEPRGSRWQAMRGTGAAMMLQEPATSLNPVQKVGDQIAETLRWHGAASSAEARKRAVDLLAEVQLPQPDQRFHWYPHQLSGGMRQRVLLATVLACSPRLLIADEPTTALDPTVQLGILRLIDRVRRARNMPLLFISHDRDVVRLMCDEMVVLAGGTTLTRTPVPSQAPGPVIANSPAPASGAGPILLGRGLKARYPDADPRILALGSSAAGVDLEIRAGEAVGLAGESGAGKSTLARVLTGHVPPVAGQVLLEGQDLHRASGRVLRGLRRQIQMVFQDPGASLNPRQKVGAALQEAGQSNQERAAALLEEVGLTPDLMARYPHQLSGGQRQRVAVARCLATNPRVIVADEVTSALDSESVAALLELLTGIRRQRQLGLLLVSHDLELLQESCHRIHVMYGGIILEQYPVRDPEGGRHPYTQHLLSSLPGRIEGGLAASEDGQKPPVFSRSEIAGGCPWQPRCKLAKPHCSVQLPELQHLASDHVLRCPETR